MEPFDEAHDLLDDAVRLRRLIHRHPELGLHLPRTQEAVLESLDGLGLQVRVGERTTSVTAVLDGAHPAPRSCCGRTCTRFPRTRRPGWRSPRRWMGRSTPAAPVMGAEDFSYHAAVALRFLDGTARGGESADGVRDGYPDQAERTPGPSGGNEREGVLLRVRGGHPAHVPEPRGGRLGRRRPGRRGERGEQAG